MEMPSPPPCSFSDIPALLLSLRQLGGNTPACLRKLLNKNRWVISTLVKLLLHMSTVTKTRSTGHWRRGYSHPQPICRSVRSANDAKFTCSCWSSCTLLSHWACMSFICISCFCCCCCRSAFCLFSSCWANWKRNQTPITQVPQAQRLVKRLTKKGAKEEWSPKILKLIQKLYPSKTPSKQPGKYYNADPTQFRDPVIPPPPKSSQLKKTTSKWNSILQQTL